VFEKIVNIKFVSQVNKTKQTMQSNIQTVLANTEKMENIDEKTNELSQQAQVLPFLHAVSSVLF
jgi:hypothetical protein